jgi:hypothetical protein
MPLPIIEWRPLQSLGDYDTKKPDKTSKNNDESHQLEKNESYNNKIFVIIELL